MASKFKYTQDIPAEFEQLFHAMCARRKWRWDHLLPVMKSESDVRSNAHNDNPKSLPPEKRYNAVGLIQFMPQTLKNMGFPALKGDTEWQSMLKLNACEQLPYVERYFMDWNRYKLDSPARFYQATFLPGTLHLGSSPDLVLTARGGPLGFAYAPNAVFDANGDGRITVGELNDAILRNARGPRWAELLLRLKGGNVAPEEHEFIIDLRTIAGIQQGLKDLGFYKGEVDGFFGPLSREGAVAFQTSAGLDADGIVGPKTIGALRSALNQRGQGTVGAARPTTESAELPASTRGPSSKRRSAVVEKTEEPAKLAETGESEKVDDGK